MDDESRDSDKKFLLCKEGSSKKSISLDHIKSLYIASGMSAKDIASQTFLDEGKVLAIIKEHALPELRQAYVREGINKIQNTQVHQAQKLMDLELNFKKMRILQLEDKLRDFLAYYARHGDFYKRHTVTGDILKDSNEIPLQIAIPNVSRELSQLKEAVTLSEGMKNMIAHIDAILNSKPAISIPDGDDDVIDISSYDTLFDSSED